MGSADPPLAVDCFTVGVLVNTVAVGDQVVGGEEVATLPRVQVTMRAVKIGARVGGCT